MSFHREALSNVNAPSALFGSSSKSWSQAGHILGPIGAPGEVVGPVQPPKAGQRPSPPAWRCTPLPRLQSIISTNQIQGAQAAHHITHTTLHSGETPEPLLALQQHKDQKLEPLVEGDLAPKVEELFSIFCRLWLPPTTYLPSCPTIDDDNGPQGGG